MNLSPRLLEVLKLSDQGLTTKGIAEQMKIKKGTAEAYCTRIKDIAGAKNMREALAKARSEGIL